MCFLKLYRYFSRHRFVCRVYQALFISLFLFSSSVKANQCENALRGDSFLYDMLLHFESSKEKLPEISKDFNRDRFLATRFYYTTILNQNRQSKDSNIFQSLRSPKDNEEKLALIEVLATSEHLKQGFRNSSPYLLNKDNYPNLLAELKLWGNQEKITLDNMYKFIDAYKNDQQLHFFKPAGWKNWLFKEKEDLNKILRQRWQDEWVVQGIYSEVPNLFSPFQTIPKSIIKKILTIGSWLLFPRVPQIGKVTYKQVHTEVEKLSDVIINEGIESAYQVFENRFQPKEQRSLRWQEFRKIVNTLLVSIFAVSVIHQIDQKIYPVNGVWTSKSDVITEIINVADRQFEERFGRIMTADERAFYESGFNDLGKRQLIYEKRSYTK